MADCLIFYARPEGGATDWTAAGEVREGESRSSAGSGRRPPDRGVSFHVSARNAMATNVQTTIAAMTICHATALPYNAS